MRTNKLLDFKPARVRRRAMAMFLGSIVLLLVLLWVGWLAISRFVELLYQKQITNQVEVLSSVIQNWPDRPWPDVQPDKAQEPGKAQEPDNARGPDEAQGHGETRNEERYGRADSGMLCEHASPVPLLSKRHGGYPRRDS